MRALVLAAIAVVFLASGSPAAAGPPAGLCRHVSSAKCERWLGSLSALEFLNRYVHTKNPSLIGAHASDAGAGGYCGLTPRHRAWYFRCQIYTESNVPASPCRVQALVSRDNAKVWHVDWSSESASCAATAGVNA
jgi:hypothetical protein